MNEEDKRLISKEVIRHFNKARGPDSLENKLRLVAHSIKLIRDKFALFKSNTNTKIGMLEDKQIQMTGWINTLNNKQTTIVHRSQDLEDRVTALENPE